MKKAIDIMCPEPDSYFDGVPEYIRSMSSEEREEFIRSETERMAVINKDIK